MSIFFDRARVVKILGRPGKISVLDQYIVMVPE